MLLGEYSEAIGGGSSQTGRISCEERVKRICSGMAEGVAAVGRVAVDGVAGGVGGDMWQGDECSGDGSAGSGGQSGIFSDLRCLRVVCGWLTSPRSECICEFEGGLESLSGEGLETFEADLSKFIGETGLEGLGVNEVLSEELFEGVVGIVWRDWICV